MKLFTTLFLIIPLFALSQATKQTEADKSKLEKFEDRSGSIIKKLFLDIGKVAGLKVQVLTIEDLTSNAKESGLRMETTPYSSLGSDTKIAYLDKDEVAGLLQTLTYFKDKVFGTTPETYTEVTYTSRSGFSASIFRDGKDWTVVLRLEKYDSRSKVYLKEKELPEIISLVEQAKAKL